MIYAQLKRASKTANAGTLGIDLQALVSVEFLLGNLEVLLKDQDDRSNIPLDAHQLAFLQQELSFLRYFLVDPNLNQYIKPEPESFNSLLVQVEAMATEAASVTRSIFDSQKKDEMHKEMNLAHSNLLEIVNLLKAAIRQMYPRVLKPSTSNFPQIPKLGFLDFFIQNFDELLEHRYDSIAYVKNEIETMQSELTLLRCSIGDAIKNLDKDENIAGRVMDVAYEAEHVIDLISASHFPRWYYILWLSDVTEKIKILRKESTEVCRMKKCNISELVLEKAPIHDDPPSYGLALEDELVGFNDQAEKIIDQLTRGPKELDIVSIVGMPGQGKTTLAMKAYKDPSITRYFHLRSWYCISQVYEKRHLLLSILGDVTELSEKIKKMKDEEMEEALCKSLRGKRYLIVIDDIWSTKPWDDIHNSFPDDCNGSRILFTSRIREVAFKANPRTHAPHDLRLFTDEESWELLQKKVFQRRNYPPELYAIGKQIAKNCKGLPLSVVVIAGILTRTEEREDCWRQISESLGKQVGNSKMGRDVLELSYNHLPDHLKPCFLYFCSFPEDTEIPVWKLIRLWIAEGLIQKTESESLENVAEGYLKDLIARSLVLVAKYKYNGKVKSCCIHDLLHEFSQEKAEAENFLLMSRDLMKTKPYRLCCSGPEHLLSEPMRHNPYLRSLTFFQRTSESYPQDLSVFPYLFKLLRVLDLGRLWLGNSFPCAIGLLVHLRYLAIKGHMNHIPLSLGNLWRLETLLFDCGQVEGKLPETLLKMAHLKHVSVSHFELPDTFPPEESFVSSIQNLSTPILCHGDGNTEEVIGSLKNLQKLKCIFVGSWDFNRHCTQFPALNLLSKLYSLNVSGSLPTELPCEFSFPSTLKKLTLTWFSLPWSEITKIGKLVPQLEVLKLLFRASSGPRWDVSDDEFCNLKVLKLEELDIVEWDASPDAFPCLEKLVLQRCKQLKEIPSRLEGLVTLRMIEVQYCTYSVTKAVQKIQQELQELGNDGLKVIIQPSEWDSAHRWF